MINVQLSRLCNTATSVDINQWNIIKLTVVVIQSPSCVWLFVTPWTAAGQTSLSLTTSWSLPKFLSIVLVMLFKHLILWCPLLLRPSTFTSIRDFSNESTIHFRRPKSRSFSFCISPSNEYSGLISLKIVWCDLFVVQRTFRSLLQHHSLMASILWRSAFFTVQLSQIVISCKQGKIKLQTWHCIQGQFPSSPNT